MAIDVQNFVIPENNFGGLYKASNTIQQNRVAKEESARQQTAKQASTASFLQRYLDPKDALTGTNYDPQIVKGFDDLLQEGTKLATQGADANMIMMALSPGVAKLNQYSTTAKLVNQRIKDQLSQVPANAGYDKSKLEQIAKKTAFYDDKGQLKDPNTIDPSVDWLTETVRLYPDQVTTDAAIDEYVKSSPKFTNTQSVKRINSRGGYELKKAKVTAPAWALVDDNGEIVPRYDVAMEGGKPHTFNFETGKGTQADIRLMNEKDFDSLMGSNPGIADWVRGQVIKAGGGGNLNTPQAKNAARAIMYDELKRRGGGGIEDIEEIKSDPAPRISIRNYSGGGNKNTPTPIDLRDTNEYPVAGEGFQDVTRLFSGIDVTGLPDGKKLKAEYVQFDPKTQTVKYKEFTGDKERKTNLTTFLQNIKTNNPALDMKYLEGLRNPIPGNGDVKKEDETPQEQKPKRWYERGGDIRVPKKIEQTKMQTKSYKVGGQTISMDKIEAGAKKYNMSVDEYLKSIGAQ